MTHYIISNVVSIQSHICIKIFGPWPSSGIDAVTSKFFQSRWPLTEYFYEIVTLLFGGQTIELHNMLYRFSLKMHTCILKQTYILNMKLLKSNFSYPFFWRIFTHIRQ